MANGFTTFKQNHSVITGLVLTTIGLVGVVGSVTGELANMIAALFVPDILFTASGGQADKGSSTASSVLGTANSVATTIEEINPVTGPIVWAEKHL